MGSIAEIRIPSELAYGKKGIPRFLAPHYLHLPLSTCQCQRRFKTYCTYIYIYISQRVALRYRVSSGIVPADCELIFEVHILEADGIQCAKELCERLAPVAFSADGHDVCHPWWLARVESLAADVWDFQFCFRFMMFHVF